MSKASDGYDRSFSYASWKLNQDSEANYYDRTPPPNESPQVPNWLILATVSICILPFCLNLLGVNFGLETKPLDLEAAAKMSAAQLADTLHRNLAGSLTHTILEWSAACAAFFTVVLSLSYFRYKRDSITPIIGIALLCAGIMDMFHLLAANRVINSAANNADLVNFTWALCRLANASLTLIGVTLLLLRDGNRQETKFSFLLLFSGCLGGLAAAIILFCTVTPSLPKTVFPDDLIRRPYDVLPLILYAMGGLFIFRRFYEKYPSLFSHALLIGTLPNIAAQLHMAFGAKAPFDNNFNIGHFFKIIGYLVPLMGLILDYSSTYQRLGSLAKSAQQVGQGDLTVSIEAKEGGDEINRVLLSFRNMVQNLNLLIEQVQKTGIKITSSANQIVSYGKQLETTITNQVSATNQATATAKEIALTSGELVQMVEQVESISQVTAQEASGSKQDLLQMEAAMRKLADGSKVVSEKLSAIDEKAHNINRVITTITLVADRTNLLSLNATIEAEKAGNYGKGFSVVAREVNRLAEQTAVAALDIETMVQEMQLAVSNATNEMDKFTKQVQQSADDVYRVSGKLESIIQQVQNLSPRFQNVSEVMVNQSQAAAQISQAMMYLMEDTSETSASLRAVNQVIEELKQVAEELRQGISQFKV
ncbi:MAG TPA: methyl-accepting chemotaxis protein [Leptolyngbyaceae cyanobacterium]